MKTLIRKMCLLLLVIFQGMVWGVSSAKAGECRASENHEFDIIDNRNFVVNITIRHNAPEPARIYIDFKMHYTSYDPVLGKNREYVEGWFMDNSYMRSGESQTERKTTTFDINKLLFIEVLELRCSY